MSRVVINDIINNKVEQAYGGTSKVLKINSNKGVYFFKKNYSRNDSERIKEYFEKQFEAEAN